MGVLDSAVAVVTGGGTGVGRGIAVAMARHGAIVAVVGRTAATLDATVEVIEAEGGRALTVVADVSRRADCDRVAAEVATGLGGIDIVVNAAHDVREGLILDMTDDDFATDWWSGFGGTIHMLQACHPHLARRSGSSVINLAAATMLKPDTTTFAAYASTKAAIRSITRTAAMEWGGQGIRVNAIIPLARTDRFDEWAAEHPDAFATILATIPMGRLGEPDRDIGEVAVWLASDEARWVTGTTVMADGGRGYLR